MGVGDGGVGVGDVGGAGGVGVGDVGGAGGVGDVGGVGTAGASMIVADAVTEGLDTEAAVTATVCACKIALGAVYCPLAVMLPTAGLIDHCTLPIPLGDVGAMAMNCCAWEGCRVTCAGLTDMGWREGSSVMEAWADPAGPAKLTAVRDMV